MGILLSQVPAADVENITYANLVAAITGGTLTPTKLYAITDYQTYYWLPDSTGTMVLWGGGPGPAMESLVVLATAVDKIDKQVYSSDFPDDTIFYDHTYNVSGAPGRIYMRRNETNNLETPFDFRTVQFRRWQNGAEASGKYTLPRHLNNVVGVGALVNSTGPANFEDYYTFGGLTLSVNQFQNIKINKLTPEYITLQSIDNRELENIVFLNPASGRVENVEIGGNNFRNTFYAVDVYDVKIGHSATNNIVKVPFNRNNLGNNLKDNYFSGTSFTQNTIADRCNINTWSGAQINGNKIADDFNNNQILANFQRNLIERNFNLNVVSATFEDCQFLRPSVGNYNWGVAMSNRKLDIDYSNIEDTVQVNNGLSFDIDLGAFPYTGIFYVQSFAPNTSEIIQAIQNPPIHPFELRPIINGLTNLDLTLDMNGQVAETAISIPDSLTLATPILTLRSLKGDWVKIRRMGNTNVQVDGQNYH